MNGGGGSNSRRRARPADGLVSGSIGSHRWWSTLTDECPITLEPLATLPNPPFELQSNGNEHQIQSRMYFDGLALASYVVSRATFQNPLTREALTWEDCVRLDQYLDTYCFDSKGSKDNRDVGVIGTPTRAKRISVKEAYGLRNAVKVGGGGGSGRGGASASATTASSAGSAATQSQEEANYRRAEALRSEAAAALRGLFVYGNDRRYISSGQDESSASFAAALSPSAAIPSAGFALNQPRHATSGAETFGYDVNGDVVLSEMEGLRIIDDDAQIAHGSDEAARKEVQNAFPRIEGSKPNDSEYNADENHPEHSALLQRAKEVAAHTQRQESRKRQLEERGRQLLIQDAIRRRADRARERAEERERWQTEREAKIAEDAEVAMARAEIEKWREQQWNMLSEMAEEARVAAAVAAAVENEKKNVDDTIINEASGSVPDKPSKEEDEQAAKDAAEARRAAKKAAKRKKDKERQKAKKAKEREERERQAKIEEERKKRAEAKLKCAHCGKGILDGGFEKFGSSFCSTKCARAGPK